MIDALLQNTATKRRVEYQVNAIPTLWFLFFCLFFLIFFFCSFFSVLFFCFFSLPMTSPLSYLAGFGSHVSSEALPGALPINQYTPQKCPYGLVAEQLSGTAFTVVRARNQRSWMYRIRPSAMHGVMEEVDAGWIRSDFGRERVNPNQLRWMPMALPDENKRVDFVEGMVTLCGAGSPELKEGMAIHLYSCNTGMKDKAFVNSDGDFLIVPQLGELFVRTEFGLLDVKPGEIIVVPRGIRFQVNLNGPCRGYIAEIFKGHFVIPDLGPIGTNGLADARHFLAPVAAYEYYEEEIEFKLVQKFLGKLFVAKMGHSPFDVVAWHGNYTPYKYDLARYCVVNSVSYGHLDPCIFTVLTAQTDEAGVAVCDFVIFPPRFAVQEDTFRPPYYHRNIMSEFMGNIRGHYDAKTTGFLPGGASLHSCMMGHGPEAEVLEKASNAELKPVKMPDDSLAFMFESTYLFKLTDYALNNNIDIHYSKHSWGAIKPHFNPNKK